MQLLVNVSNKLDYDDPILEGVYLVDDSEAYAKFSDNNSQASMVRLYIGFAGLAPGRLESELLWGDWYLWYADVKTIFVSDIDSI